MVGMGNGDARGPAKLVEKLFSRQTGAAIVGDGARLGVEGCADAAGPGIKALLTITAAKATRSTVAVLSTSRALAPL
jgi:hypothetical protein